jgi:hypothetical protein
MLKKALIGLAAIFICQIFLFQTTSQAGILVSPYYRYFLPQNNNSEPCKTLDTITYGGQRIILFTKERSHQFGVETSARRMVIQTIERRPFTARSSIFDDGRIFQYWELHDWNNKSFKILFGYTTDPKVEKVRLKLKNDLRELKLYNRRYFFCVLNPDKDTLIEAQGLSTENKVLRTWNGQYTYQARRTWLSFFVQTYPYVIS